MAHHFTVKEVLMPGTLEQARIALSNPEFHLAVCHKVPSENLQVLSSTLNGSQYLLKRTHNLDVNIPEVAKKLLSGAFKLNRQDEWDIDKLQCQSSFTMNMPSSFRNHMRVTEENGNLMITVDWEVKVSVPLIGGMLARHAESEIRRFSDIELQVVRDEIQNGAYV